MSTRNVTGAAVGAVVGLFVVIAGNAFVGHLRPVPDSGEAKTLPPPGYCASESEFVPRNVRMDGRALLFDPKWRVGSLNCQYLDPPGVFGRCGPFAFVDTIPEERVGSRLPGEYEAKGWRFEPASDVAMTCDLEIYVVHRILDNPFYETENGEPWRTRLAVIPYSHPGN